MMKILSIITLVLFISVSGFSQESKITREFFGVDFWSYEPTHWQAFLELLDEDNTNFGLLGFSIGWEMIEPDPPVQGVHQYNWSQLDEFVQLGVSSGRVFDLNILIRSNWATVIPASEIDELCCDMSPVKEDVDSNTAQWGMTAYQAYSNFIRTLVERYDADGVDDAPGINSAAIKYLQLGDEPEALSHFIEYGGTPENYNRMLATMYSAAKSADANILVVRGKSNPGSIFDDDPDEATLLARRADYFDFISTSLQLGEANFDIFAINYNDHYTGLVPFTRWLQAEMAENGYSKPLMVGDARTTAWPRGNDGNTNILPRRYPAGFAESLTDASNPQHSANRKLYHADEARQSLRKILIALASGQRAISLQPAWGPIIHERMFWQDAGLLDTQIAESTGNMSAARKPVYYAVKQLLDALVGADLPINVIDLGADVYAYQISQQGEDIFFLWHENQLALDPQGLVLREQSITVDLSPFITTQQVRVKQFVTELNASGTPVYPAETEVSANTLVINETPVIVTAVATGQTGVLVPCVGCEQYTQRTEPHNGMWYNQDQTAQGFSIDVQNGKLFGVYYGYDQTGGAIWQTFVGDLVPSEATNIMWTVDATLNQFSNSNCFNCDIKGFDLVDGGSIQVKFRHKNYASIRMDGGAEQHFTPFVFGHEATADFPEQTKYLLPDLEGMWTLVYRINDAAVTALVSNRWGFTSKMIYIGEKNFTQTGEGLEVWYAVEEYLSPPEIVMTGMISCKLEDVDGQLQGPVCKFDDYIPFWFDPLGPGHEFVFPLGGLGAYRMFGETIDGHTFEAIKVDSTIFDS